MLRWIKRNYIGILIFLVYVAVRVPDLGHDMFNTDVWKWKARTYDFGTGVFTLDFEKTIQKYHPGVTLMWLGTLAVKAFGFYTSIFEKSSISPEQDLVFGLHFTQKLFVTLTIASCLAMSGMLLKKLFGLKYALISLFLIALDPFYTGLTRTFHLEGLMSTFMIASSLFFYLYLKEREKKHLIFSGILAGLSMLTKISAVYMLPFFGLVLLLDFLLKGRKSLSFYAKSLLFVTLVSILTFVLVWPALWTHPGKALEALYKGVFTVGVETDHNQFYFGKYVGDPGPAFYLVVLALKSSIYLLPGLVGFVILYKRLSAEEKKFSFYYLLFAFFYLIQLTLPSKKLDRYILPSMMSLLLVVSLTFSKLLPMARRTIWIFLILLILPGLIYVVRLHPDYLSYYNPYFGGLKKGIFILEPKWMFGQGEIVQSLRTIDPPYVFTTFGTDVDHIDDGELSERRVVGFQEKYYTQIWPFIEEAGMLPIIMDLTPHALKAQYFVYPVWDDTSLLEDRFDLQKIKSVYLHNVEIYRIYKKVS